MHQSQTKKAALVTLKLLKQTKKKYTFITSISVIIISLLFFLLQTSCSDKKTKKQETKIANTPKQTLNQPFVKWLKNHITTQYPKAKITDHGGWFQAHLPNDVVVNWAEWNENNVTLKDLEAHALSNGKKIFIEKKKKQNWSKTPSVNYYDRTGYYITEYNSNSMNTWKVEGSTVIQFDGNPTKFIEKMTKAWGNKLKTTPEKKPPFVTWLKDYTSTKYSGSKIDDHGGWFQAHVPNLVISWAEWNEEGITLSGVHSLDEGEAIFVDKKNKVWPTSKSVIYFEGAGYYITRYNSESMANWNVKGSTVAQLRGNHKEFIKVMAKDWIKTQ